MEFKKATAIIKEIFITLFERKTRTASNKGVRESKRTMIPVNLNGNKTGSIPVIPIEFEKANRRKSKLKRQKVIMKGVELKRFNTLRVNFIEDFRKGLSKKEEKEFK